ncbi:MAG TPA: OadG family protein [Candidatus Limiplasma sp.]|nr:OadG family protein [Candidatus Limiplasma sp.]HPS81926.1 OadG family protein [Candidatus Limiplasma sp.]
MDKLLFGLTVALIGMLVVFAGLILLIGCINLITYFSGKPKRGEKAETTEAPTALEPAVEEAPAVFADTDEISSIPTETLIAITTALMAMMQTSQGLVVRHVRRINNAPAWNRAGREDQIYSRM